jgi:hypothetical protein
MTQTPPTTSPLADGSTPTPDQAHRTDRTNHWRFRKRGWVSPTRGARLPSHLTGPLDLIQATLLVLPEDATFSERTAGLILGAPLPGECDMSRPHVTVPAGGRHLSRAAIVCHRRDLPDDERTFTDGIPVTTGERTFIDLGSALRLPRLVALGDDLLRRRLLDPDTLHKVIQRSWKQRGIVNVRKAAALLDARSESPQESVARVFIGQAGLPMPEPNVDIFDEYGEFLARGDLVYLDLKIVIEYDGEHHLSREQQAKDAARRHRLTRNGWFVITIVAEDLRQPRLLIRKITEALALRGYPKRASVR